jgi:predicted DNA-binding transcriptional regulator AlpA
MPSDSTINKNDSDVTAPKKAAAQMAYAEKAAALKAANTSADNQSKPEVLLSKAEVLKRVGRTFPTIWAWMLAGKFPPARDLGGRPAWLETEINDWIKNLPIRRYKAAHTELDQS